MKKLFTSCFFIILITTCAKWVRSQAGPTLLTQENSTRAVALDSVTLVHDPLAVVNRDNFSSDRRTRLALFGINIDLMPGEGASAVTARARDSSSRSYGLNVEFVRKVPTVNGDEPLCFVPRRGSGSGKERYDLVEKRAITRRQLAINSLR